MQYPQNNTLVIKPAVPGLSGLQPHQMRLETFRREVIAIRVIPQMVKGVLRLECVNSESEIALDRYAQSIQPMAPPSVSDPLEWATGKMRGLLAVVFPDDSWCSAPQGYPPLLLVKESALQREEITLDRAIGLAHLDYVSFALGSGLVVPEAVLAQYNTLCQVPSARELH